MTKSPSLMLALFLCAIMFQVVLPNSLQALEEPSVNLGASSFFDGMAAIRDGQADSGFYFNQYAQWYSASRFDDNQGHSMPGTPHLDVYTSLTQLIYLLDKPHILGGRLGFDALIPLVGLNASPGNTILNANPNVLGDLTIGVALQFDPIMYGTTTNPLFMHRIDFDVIVPTGDYDRRYALNPGANFLSFNPYWAGTLFLGSNVVSSWRLHYLWNDANREPEALYGPFAQKVQAGQAVHLNFDAAYAFFDHRLFAGFNGYFFKQFTQTRINDAGVPGRDEQVLGFGPGAVLNFKRYGNLFINVYFETAVENRPSGCRLNLLYACHF